MLRDFDGNVENPQDQANERSLFTSEQQFQIATELSPVGMMLLDHNGVIRLHNQQLFKIFGYEFGELVGKPCELLVPMESRKTHADYVKKFQHETVSRLMDEGREFPGPHKDGKTLFVEIALTQLHVEDEMMTFANVVEVTQRILAKLQPKLAADIGEMGF